MVRRGVAGVIGLILLILIVLGISSCQKSAQRSALKSYNNDVNAIARDSDQNVGVPFFSDLQQAGAKGALSTEVALNQLYVTAQNDVNRAQGLSVPGPMASAQRDLLLALDFRKQAVHTVANQITAAMGGTNATQAVQIIAGQMEVLLAADVVYSQRVAPLIQQALADHDIRDQATVTSRWVRSLDWLAPATVSTALTGVAGTGSFGGAIAPGVHGHRLVSVAVGANTLAAGVVNHVAAGTSPAFTATVANVGTNPEANVKITASVTAGGLTRSGSTVIARTLPGKTTTANVTVPGVPLGVPARVTVNVGRVPGEQSVLHNHQTFTAIFSQ